MVSIATFLFSLFLIVHVAGVVVLTRGMLCYLPYTEVASINSALRHSGLGFNWIRAKLLG